MINTKSIDFARNALKKEPSPKIVLAQDDKFNRKMLEIGGFDIILSLESGNRNDSLKKVDSGINHILAKIAYKNKIAIGIDLKEIRVLQKKELSIRISKIIQIIKIARKENCKIIALNYRNKKDTMSLLMNLGASSIQAVQAISF